MEVENVIKRTEKIMMLETLSTFLYEASIFLSEKKVFICFIRRKKLKLTGINGQF